MVVYGSVQQNKNAERPYTSRMRINSTVKRMSSALAVRGSCRAFWSFTTASPYFRRAASIRWLGLAKGAHVSQAIAITAGIQGEEELAAV